VTSLPALNGGASYKRNLIVGGFRTEIPERRLSGLPTLFAVSCGAVTSTPVPWRVTGVRFQSAPLSPWRPAMLVAVARSRRDLAARQTTSGDRVDIRLVLRHPTLIVRASERRLRRPRTEVAVGVARLGRVRRVHLLHWDTRFEGFVFDASGETCERPVVEPAEGREHLFAEVSRSSAVVDVRFGWIGVPPRQAQPVRSLDSPMSKPTGVGSSGSSGSATVHSTVT
jgi:hypothetical protein